MIDLSNNNGRNIDFARIAAAGHHRVYLKLSEGVNFHDGLHAGFRAAAHAVGIRVGSYHFARPSRNSAADEAAYFLRHLPHPLRVGNDLRPCLDLEDPDVRPGPHLGFWAEEFLQRVRHGSGHTVVIYGSSSYLQDCHFHFHQPAGVGAHLPPLWLASYGRNDGKEHPYTVPAPWKHAAAHQYSSEARVAGVPGRCDISRVFVPQELDVAVTR